MDTRSYRTEHYFAILKYYTFYEKHRLEKNAKELDKLKHRHKKSLIGASSYQYQPYHKIQTHSILLISERLLGCLLRYLIYQECGIHTFLPFQGHCIKIYRNWDSPVRGATDSHLHLRRNSPFIIEAPSFLSHRLIHLLCPLLHASIRIRTPQLTQESWSSCCNQLEWHQSRLPSLTSPINVCTSISGWIRGIRKAGKITTKAVAASLENATCAASKTGRGNKYTKEQTFQMVLRASFPLEK